VIGQLVFDAGSRLYYTQLQRPTDLWDAALCVRQAAAAESLCQSISVDESPRARGKPNHCSMERTTQCTWYQKRARCQTIMCSVVSAAGAVGAPATRCELVPW